MHSHSFLTPFDFEAFDWTQSTTKTGVVTLKEYEAVRKENKCPNGWSGSVGGSNIVTISAEEANSILDKGQNAYNGSDIYVQYYWPVLYSDWFSHTIKDTIEPLKALQEKYGEARICFGFDN